MARPRLLVVGAGMAAVRFVDELTARAPHAYDIIVLGAEKHRAYNRVLLSPLLAGEMCEDDLALKPDTFWAERGIDLQRGTRVARLDREGSRVELANGETLAYDKLVLATGSQAIRLPKPGMDLPGVVTFRDLDDARSLAHAAHPGAPIAIIGGGLLGLEAAFGLARLGANVTLVHLMDRLMERQLDPRAASLLRDAMEARGVRVLLEADTARVRGDTRAEGLDLTDGRFVPADLVVCAVGVRPETTLARAAGLACGRAILVDDELATSDDAIFALGECAEHRGIAYGLVEPAYHQAQVLARHLAGDTRAAYTGSLLATNLKGSGIGLFSAGDFEGRAGAHVLTYADESAGVYRKLVIDGDRLTGALLYGDTADAHFYLDLIRNGTNIANQRDTLVFGPLPDLAEAA